MCHNTTVFLYEFWVSQYMCDVFPWGLQWFVLPFLLAVITLASKAEGCGIPNLTQEEEAVLSVE